MGLPDETSWECETCGVFNIQNGTITGGKMFCDDCYHKSLGIPTLREMVMMEIKTEMFLDALKKFPKKKK